MPGQIRHFEKELTRRKLARLFQSDAVAKGGSAENCAGLGLPPGFAQDEKGVGANNFETNFVARDPAHADPAAPPVFMHKLKFRAGRKLETTGDGDTKAI